MRPGRAGLVAAGAFALVVAGALPAAAATYDPPTADQLSTVRQCESSGRYTIDTHNGYYGAYQFDDPTWASYRTDAAEQHASNGSVAEQDDAASRLWEDRGTAPWPTCARNLTATPSSGSSAPPSSSTGVTPPPGDASSSPGTTGGRITGRPAGIAGVPLARAARPAAAPATSSAASTSAVTVPTGTAPAPGTTPAPARTVAPEQVRQGATARSAPAGSSLAVTPRTPHAGAATPQPAAYPAWDGHLITTADEGSVRSDVMTWQRRMVARGWSLDVDGQFGPASKAVAEAFSNEKGVVDTVPGEVGHDVWTAAWTYVVQ